jgi:hypothetical protein
VEFFSTGELFKGMYSLDISVLQSFLYVLFCVFFGGGLHKNTPMILK